MTNSVINVSPKIADTATFFQIECSPSVRLNNF